MRQRPYVLVNMAVTADGKIETVERRAAHILGPGDTSVVARLRADADADAVIAGRNTLVAALLESGLVDGGASP